MVTFLTLHIHRGVIFFLNQMEDNSQAGKDRIMNLSKIFKTLLIFFLILGFNYGVSFQQFLHFDWDDPRGSSDSSSYLAMSNGDYNVSSEHRYRVIVPFLANLVRQVVQPAVPPDQLYWAGGVDAFSFYVVNFFITSLAGLFLYLFLIKLKFETRLSLLGVFIFLGSRITVFSTGGPVVDSIYHLAIIIVVYLCLTQQAILLSLLTPFLILTKETTIPFLFLPLLLKTMNRKIILLSLSLSFVILFWVRSMITATIPDTGGANDPIFNILATHLAEAVGNIGHTYFSLAGWHGLFSTFSIFWVFAALGVWREFKEPHYQIPRFLLGIIPITLLTTVLSSNVGRMLLSLFPLVIPYVLIGIEHLLSPKEKTTGSPS